MKVPRGITARELIRALTHEGFEWKRTRGSHHVYFHPDGRVTIVPYHKLSDTFPIGTLRDIISAVKWTEDDLRRLGLVE